MTVPADRTSSRSASAGLPEIGLSKVGRPKMELAKVRLPKFGLHKAGLPKRFPVGTTYVVEGRRSDGSGGLRVISRYVVLPSGRGCPVRC